MKSRITYCFMLLVLLGGCVNGLQKGVYQEMPAEVKEYYPDGPDVLVLVRDGVDQTEKTNSTDPLQRVKYRKGKGQVPPNVAYVSLMREENGWSYTVHSAPNNDPFLTHYNLVLDKDKIPDPEYIIIPSSYCYSDPDCRQSMDIEIAFLREVGKKAKAIIAHGSATFLLAEAGMLKGLEATTHPAEMIMLTEGYPDVKLVEGASVVVDQHSPSYAQMWTSPGGQQSFSATMLLIQQLYGEKVAGKIGRSLVADWEISDIKFKN